MIKLYQIEGCPFAHRTRIVLEEKKLPFEAVPFERDRVPPELRALGPKAKSPTLFDGEVKLYDSSIIDEYLDDRYPDWPLMPPDASHRAQVRTLMKEVEEELAPRLGAVVAEMMRPEGERDRRKLDLGREGFRSAMPGYDRRLDGRSFFVGDEMTLADVHLYTLFPAMRRALRDDLVAKELTHLRGWLATMEGRAAR